MLIRVLRNDDMSVRDGLVCCVDVKGCMSVWRGNMHKTIIKNQGQIVDASQKQNEWSREGPLKKSKGKVDQLTQGTQKIKLESKKVRHHHLLLLNAGFYYIPSSFKAD